MAAVWTGHRACSNEGNHKRAQPRRDCPHEKWPTIESRLACEKNLLFVPLYDCCKRLKPLPSASGGFHFAGS